MATFESLFPTFLQKCAELHELLRLVAFLLFTVGTILFVVRGLLCCAGTPLPLPCPPARLVAASTTSRA